MKFIPTVFFAAAMVCVIPPNSYAQAAEPEPPPAKPVEQISCSHNQILVGGKHLWKEGRWVWQAGHCREKPAGWREGCEWRDGAWERKGDRYVWRAAGMACPDDKPAVPPETRKTETKSEKPPVKTAAPPVKKPDPAKAPILAVFDIEVAGFPLSESYRNSLADFLAMRLAESKTFRILPRSDLKARLAQSKKDTYKKCYDQSCQIEIGRELAAEKTLSTKISKLGSKCTISAGIYDLRKASTDSAATMIGGCSEDAILESAEAVVKKLVQF